MNGRQCGDCQLCCTLLPVVEINKPASKRCQHQRFGKGCNIYPDRPPACKLWSCMWILDTDLIGRPDRVHYVVDPMIDMVAGSNHVGEVVHAQATQVWCDPKHPNAHRDPALRAYLLTLPTQGLAIIRYSSKEGFLLVPPERSHTGDWYEKESHYVEELPEGPTTDQWRTSGLQADHPT